MVLDDLLRLGGRWRLRAGWRVWGLRAGWWWGLLDVCGERQPLQVHGSGRGLVLWRGWWLRLGGRWGRELLHRGVLRGLRLHLHGREQGGRRLHLLQLLQVQLHLHGGEGWGWRLLILLQQHLGRLREQGGLGQGWGHGWGPGGLGGQRSGSIAGPRRLLGQRVVQSWRGDHRVLVEMRRSAVLGCRGQVGGQLGLRQVQDGLGEVADGVEDTARELGLEHGHLGSDEGRWGCLQGGRRLRWQGGRGRCWRWWRLLLRRWWRLLLGSGGCCWLLGRCRGLLGRRGRGRLHLRMVVVVMLLLLPPGAPLLFGLWSHVCF